MLFVTHGAFIPVIVLSGLAQKNEAKLRQEGATAYFEKSKLANPDALIDLVRRTLGGGRTLWRWTQSDVKEIRAFKAANYRRGRGRKNPK